MTKRLGQMIDEGKIDLDQYLIMHPFSASTKKVYLYDDQTMKIEFNCEDVIRRALEKYGT